MTAWHHDPRERALFLDGELPQDEQARRVADLARDPEARRLVEADERFLAVVRTAKGAQPRPSDLLEARVRRALAEDRAAGFPSSGAGDAGDSNAASRGGRYAGVAAAAAVLAIAGWAVFADRAAPTADADNIRHAAQIYVDFCDGRGPIGRAGGSCDEGPASPHRYPLVASGENAVEACAAESDARTAAVLRSAAGGPAGVGAKGDKGLLVVPWSGQGSPSEVVYTRVKDSRRDIVVFSVAIGPAKYYLSVPWASVAGTKMCAACHGPEPAARPNPHHFVPGTALVYEPK